ncbi:MAG: thioredoxin domain-containing protein [Nitrosomonas sp. PRO4]|nr:thioredoxin domain-containing protein [Nitrosomonas sp. PRO4]
MTNHLSSETSPYLLQHSGNPVDWYPWGEQALDLARTQNKPILLSIGYSACHWCHVMAHESFENTEVAAVMNEHFINIKVDREERPDIDQIYQTAHYIMNHRSGGWPLTMFLTPEQKPYFGGTYFPLQPRYGLPGFLELLPRVAEAYYTRSKDIEKQGRVLLTLMNQTLPDNQRSSTEQFSAALLTQAIQHLEEQFDPVYGGFGQAPKFLHPAELTFCLHQYFKAQNTKALQMTVFTLEKMATGGIYDQLGGGFYRYSTDGYWCIPHFEKMLYDNGPLLHLYTTAWLATNNPLFKQIVSDTAQWVIREMQSDRSDEGGYYSTLDADSEHEEGKYYVWDRDEIAQVLTAEEFAVIAPYYGLSQAPNFEQKLWNLVITTDLVEIAQRLDITLDQALRTLLSGRTKLQAIRARRVRPGRDEKILVSWNGLMIKGMAHAGRIFGQVAWIQSAQRAADFIRTMLWKNNRLLATYKDGKAHLNAYLDDYVFLLDGLLELMQTEFRIDDLEFSTALAEVLLEQFEDRQNGGFYFTSHDHEQLIHRPKPVYDNAMASGNGMVAIVLQRLGLLLSEPRYLQAAERTIRLFYPMMSTQLNGYCSLLTAMDETLFPPVMIILRGHSDEMVIWQYTIQRQFPQMFVLTFSSELINLPPSLSKAVSTEAAVDSVRAWVCTVAGCMPEITNLQDLLQICKVQGRISNLL